MAEMQRDTKPAAGGQDQPKTSIQPVDIFSKNLPEGNTRMLDLSEDWQARADVPPAGTYRVKLFEARQEPVVMGKTQQGDVFYSVNMEARLQSDDERYNGYPIDVRASTMPYRGKTKSPIVGILEACGFKLKSNQVTDLMVTQTLVKHLKTEPVVWVDIEWGARAQNGKGEWVAAARKMADFPLKDGVLGEHESTATITLPDGTRKEVNARVSIVHWHGVNAPAQAKGKAPAPAPTPAPAKATAKAKPAPAPEPEPETVSSDDLSLAFDGPEA